MRKLRARKLVHLWCGVGDEWLGCQGWREKLMNGCSKNIKPERMLRWWITDIKGYLLVDTCGCRPWHWLCARWPACLFEAVGPVRATTIYFPLARGASGFFFFFFFFSPSYAAIILLGIGKTRKATLITTYFSLYIGLMYKSLQLHAWNHKFPPRKHLGGQWVFWGASGFSDSLVATVQCQGLGWLLELIPRWPCVAASGNRHLVWLIQRGN